MSGALFTIGYQGAKLEQVVASLAAARVSVLVDTRETPMSRRVEFRQRALASALGDARIRYVSVRALGAPKPLRALAADDWAGFAAGYRERLAVAREELERLVPSSPPSVSVSSASRPTPRPATGRCSLTRSSDCWTSPPSTFDLGGRTRPMITNVWWRLARLPTTK